MQSISNETKDWFLSRDLGWVSNGLETLKRTESYTEREWDVYSFLDILSISEYYILIREGLLSVAGDIEELLIKEQDLPLRIMKVLVLMKNCEYCKENMSQSWDELESEIESYLKVLRSKYL